MTSWVQCGHKALGCIFDIHIIRSRCYTNYVDSVHMITCGLGCKYMVGSFYGLVMLSSKERDEEHRKPQVLLSCPIVV